MGTIDRADNHGSYCVSFGIHMNKSRRSRKYDTVIMRHFVCKREGFYSKRVIFDDGKKKWKRVTNREDCMAMIEVIRRDHDKRIITKLVTEYFHMTTMRGKVCPLSPPSCDDLTVSEKSSGFSTAKNLKECKPRSWLSSM